MMRRFKSIKIFLLGCLLLAILPKTGFSQVLNDYRSAASGNWNVLATWERYNGAAWVTPTAGQGTPTNGVVAITIRSSHVVTVTANVTADQVIIEAGGQVTVNNGITFTVNNGTGTDLTNNGTFLLNGTLAGSGSTLNNSTFTSNGSLGGTGTYTQGANSTLTNSGATIPITTFISTAAGNTVNYLGAAQTVRATTYVNLTLSGSGDKAFPAATTINGAFDVQSGTNALVNVNSITVAATGSTTVSGTLTIATTGGTKNFNSDVTINPGGVWNETVNEGITFAGNLTNNGTFTANIGTHAFTGASKNFSGSSTLTIPTLSVTGTYTNNNNIVVSTSLAGTGTLTQAVNSNLYLGGTTTITNLNATATGNSVYYNRTAGNQTIKGTTYYNLIIDKTGRIGTLGTATTVNGDLLVLAGTLSDGGFQLTGNNTGALSMAAGTRLNLGTNTLTTSFPTNFATGNISLATTSTVNYNSNFAQTISSVPSSYGNLTLTCTLTTGVIKTADGSIFVNGNLNLGQYNNFADNGSTISVKGNVLNNGRHSGAGKIILENGAAVHAISGGVSFFGNLELNDTQGATLAGTSTTTISGNLAITDGALSLNTITTAFVVSGNTNISGTGTLNITNATGTKTFTGDVVINNGGIWNNSPSNELVTFRGSLQNDGTYNAGTGVQTFIGANKTFSGSSEIVIPNLTITSPGVYVNNGNLKASVTLIGTGSLTQGTGATLSIGGTSTITALAATAVGNTVTYYGAAQTVRAIDYYHLTLSGSAIKTMPATARNIGGNFTTTGTITATALNVLNISGDVVLGSGTTFNSGTFSHSVRGNWSNNGATFAPSTGRFTFNGSNVQNIGGTNPTSFNNLTINNSSGVVLGNAVNAAGVILSNGIVTTTSANLLTVTGTAAGAITGSASSYVNGPLSRNLPLVANGNYAFPVGKSGYNPLEIININTTGNLTILAEVFDADCGGTAGTGMSSLNTDRFWNATISSGSGNFTNAQVRLTEGGLDSEDAIGQSSTQTGAYNKVSTNAPSGGTITSDVISSLGYFVLGKKPSITIEATLDGSEGGSNGQFTLTTSRQFNSAVTVSITISGTATNGTDYSTINNSVTFPANQNSMTLDVDVTDDASVEVTETVIVTIESGAGYVVGTPLSATININDNDVAGITVSSISGPTSEAGDEATFTIVLTSQPAANVSVALSSGNTSEGIVLSPSVMFTPSDWNTPQTVTARGVNDNIDDGDQPYTIVTAPASSTDNDYQNLNADDVLVSNTNDDTAGITVDPTTGLVTTEAEVTDQFTIVLNSEPTADVTLTLWSDNTNEGNVSPASVTFIPSEWNIPKTITVTGVNDFVVDGTIAYQIISDKATSTDLLYNVIDPSDVSVTNADNDVAGFTVNPLSGLQTSEAIGGTATFTIKLKSQPVDLVTVTFSSSDLSEGTVSPESVTFDNTDWNTNKTITLTGVDGPDSDGDQTYYVSISSSTSDDLIYQAVSDLVLTVINVDNDTPGFTVNPTTLTTDESGGYSSFSIVPNSRPQQDVTITIDSYDATEGSLSTTSLIFTYDNWDTPQSITVTGVDDAVDDGDITYSIVFNNTASADPDYNNRTLPSITVTNTDDDVAGITVNTISGNTSEAGSSAMFTIVLTSEPTANVTINLSTSDASEGTIDPSYVEFIPGEWNIAQTITVTGVDDFVQDGNITFSIITDQATSTDVIYAAINPPNVTVVNNDNDVAGFDVTPTSGLVTSEGGISQTFSIRLTSEPTANVTVQFTSSDPTEGIVSPVSCTFTPIDWNTLKEILITGQDDDEVDGTASYSINSSVVPGSDAIYNSKTPSPVSVTNTDNDVAGITVSPSSGLTTTEASGAGHTTTFTIKLTSKPSANVTIGVTSLNTAEGTVSPATVTFNPANWNTTQTITVTGVDESILDGNNTYNTRLFIQSTTDLNYSIVPEVLVPVTNIDNDVAGITVNAAPGLSTSETGATATFTVELTSQPISDVTLSISTSNSNEGVPDQSSLVFTSANWNSPTMVTISGVDDYYIDGDIAYTIYTAAVSGDPNYNGLNAADVSVTNIDDDVAQIIVDPTSGLTTNEDGSQATFTIKLASIPTDNVTIALSSSNTAEGTVSPASLVITPANWNADNTVTITGVDDQVDDDDQNYSILTEFSTSSDGNYNGINPDNVEVTNEDNDVAGITVNASGTLITSENGTTATFTIVLDTEPTSNVTINFSYNSNEGTLSSTPWPVVFTPANWNTVRTITVTGKDDNDHEGDIEYTITSTASSSDVKYDGLSDASVSVINQDNDIPGITVNPSSGLITTEAGGQATFTVVLNSKPKQSVTINLSSNNIAEGVVSPSTLTFTTSGSNWSTPQSVTVTGVNDVLSDGDQSYAIEFDITSSDNDYNNFLLSDATVSNTDLTPTITLGTNPTVCGGVISANLTYLATTKTPDQYSIDFNAAAEAQGFSDVSFTTLTSSPIHITVPAGALAGTYSGVLKIINSTYSSCVSPDYTISVTINRVTGGTIADNQSVCNDGDPAILTSTLNGSGSGTFTYRWEMSTTNCSDGFGILSGVTGNTYDPPSGLTQTTYYRRVSISMLNGASCEAISNCVTVTVNTVSVLITAIYGDDECPELDPLKGFNPENGINYSSGSTEVVFRVLIQNSSAATWEFDYEIQGATVHATSPKYQSGTISGISANKYDLLFHITNNPGNPINVKLVVTEVSDSGGCSDPTDREETINILPMPSLGSFN